MITEGALSQGYLQLNLFTNNVSITHHVYPALGDTPRSSNTYITNGPTHFKSVANLFSVVGPVLNTREPNMLLQHLDEIQVYGGGDCPEMSLSGIKLGLENAQPSSFVYIFTDADAKDAFLYNEVLDIAMAKRTSVSSR